MAEEATASVEAETAELVTLTPIEEKAMAMGWKPKADFSGLDEEFVEAKEFVGREKLYSKIHDQTKKIADVEKTLQATARHIQKVEDIAYKRAIAELNKDRKIAINNSDLQGVNDIDNQLNELQSSSAEPNVPPEAYTTWVKDNPWFSTDPELYDFACATYDTQVKRNPSDNDLGKVLENVTKITKRAYPEKFASAEPKVTQTVEGGTRPSTVKTSPGYSSLSSEQKKVCDTFVRSGVMTRDAYVKSLIDIGEL